MQVSTHPLRMFLALALVAMAQDCCAEFRSISQDQQLIFKADSTLAVVDVDRRVDGINLNPGFEIVVSEDSPQKPRKTPYKELSTPVKPLPPSYYANQMQRTTSNYDSCTPKSTRLYLTQFTDYIAEASNRFGVEEALLRSIIHVESAFKITAKSNKKAQGLMQLIPSTAARFGVKDVFNPYQNIQGGAEYLAWLLKRYNGDIRLAAAGYNAGEGAVDRYGGIPPYKETQNYVVKVVGLLYQYRNFTSPSIASLPTYIRTIC